MSRRVAALLALAPAAALAQAQIGVDNPLRTGENPAIETRLKALESLRARSKNSNERGWLDYHIRVAKKRLSG